MTEPVDPSIPALGELIGRVARLLRAGDDAAARSQAAAEVEQLCEIVAHADRARSPDRPAMFDVARLTEALRVFAAWLRAPTRATEAEAEQAIAELQAIVGPGVGWQPPRDEAAERAYYRTQASASIDAYFRDHPIKPVKL